jgi:hypothetical protein
MIEKGSNIDKEIEEDMKSGIDRFTERKIKLNGLSLITIERARHFELGYDEEHDSFETNQELAVVAGLYTLDGTYANEIIDEAITESGRDELWPWKDMPDQRGKMDRIKQLSVAGALIAAEIDRLQALGEEPNNDNTNIPNDSVPLDGV